MMFRQELERIRQTYGIRVVDMCNVLLLATEQEYWDTIHGHRNLSLIQLIGVMEVFQIPLESIKM